MPRHDFECLIGHVTESMVAHGVNEIACGTCSEPAHKVFLRAPTGFVQKDICYDSPVDGRPITSLQAHREELARTDSVVYEPGIKQDQERNARLRDEAVEKSIDQTVEKEIATMPARKFEKLAAELTGGLTAEVSRVTPPQTSFREAAP